jgi:hypothetical protein
MADETGMSIYEVFEYGPIVFANVEWGVLITINGAYLNWWNHGFENGIEVWYNTECRSGHPNLYKLITADAMDLAEAWFNEVMDQLEKDNKEDEIGT